MAKFSITMKNPDWQVNEDEMTPLSETDKRFIARYMGWDEYLTVEFDSAKRTARVMTVKEQNAK